MLKANITKLNKWFANLKPPQVFLAVAVPVGLLLCLLTPPFMVPDEQAHFFRAYQVSEGGVLPQKFDGGVGGYLPKSLVDTSIVLVGTLPGNASQTVSIDTLFSEFNRPLKANDRTYTHFENTALYSPVVYAPTAFGVGIARLLDMPALSALYIGRIFTVITWIGIVYCALRFAPFGRWALMALALSPMALFQAASVSADAFTLALCFLAAAWFARLVVQPHVLSRRDWLATIALLLVMGFIKQPYALLGLAFFFLPAVRFAGKKQRWQFIVSAATALLVPVGAMYAASKAFFMQSPFLTDRILQPDAQLLHILQYPFDFIHTFLFTHLTLNGDGHIAGFVGVFGWLDAPLPFWTILLYLFGLLVALGIAQQQRLLPRRQRAVALAVCAAAFVVIDVLLYMYWNALGADVVNGIQGRYYLMLAPLAVLAISGCFTIGFKKVSSQFIVVGCVGLSLLMAVYTILQRFYL